MGNKCAPLAADLFCFLMRETSCCLRQTSRYLDDLLNIDNSYFEQMVGQIYPTEL